MEKRLFQTCEKSLLDDPRTYKKLELNFKRNKVQDNAEGLDTIASGFIYNQCKDQYWNPEQFSLLYKTPLWDQSTEAQRIKLNQLYWVAYYSQIISAEIATIFFNQTSAAGLYGIEDFRLVCDTLDLESAQERAHIAAFKKVSEALELEVFGERVFTYPMRGPYAETMIFQDTTPFKEFWKKLNLYGFSLLSSSNAFVACQYFTVRGLRTLCGKLTQHQLSQFYAKHPEQETAPIPSKISYLHFLDESYHFNSSTIIGLEVINSLKAPTAFERHIGNMMIAGCQKDHFNFSTAISGIFWYDPATYPVIYRLLRSDIFRMGNDEALQMMEACFAGESEGTHLNAKAHRTALESYREYVSKLDYVNGPNKEMRVMAGNSLERHLATNKAALKTFKRRANQVQLIGRLKAPGLGLAAGEKA